MKPTLVLVGRPNVGKSTLFNRLTKTRDALVADLPGLTRDRHYGLGRIGERGYIVVDTGGFEPGAREGIFHEMARQAEQAVAEADLLVFIVDGREGLTPLDQAIAERLRRSGRPVLLAVNKAEGKNRDVVASEFHELGCGEPLSISAAHGEGVRELVARALSVLPGEAQEDDEAGDAPKVAVVGRPNVGKSTLINTMLGEERMIAFDKPGTTRDAIAIAFERDGRAYTLIDTAGLRRKGRVFESVEKFSVIKTLQAIEDANIVVLVLDAEQEVSEQDTHIAGFVLEAGRAVVVAANKWDAVEGYQRERFKADLKRKLNFLGFAHLHYISALTGEGVAPLFKSVDSAYAAAMAKLPTPRLTRVLQSAVARQAPPRHGIFRPKLRYAHQGGSNPPLIVVHGNALDHVPEGYQRYLQRVFMESFKLQGTPLRVHFKTTRNPYTNGRK